MKKFISKALRLFAIMTFFTAFFLGGARSAFALDPTIIKFGVSRYESTAPTNPTIATVGENLRIHYWINNPNSTGQQYGLGASIISSTNQEISDTANDVTVWIPASPTDAYTGRTFHLNPEVPPGVYDVIVSLWTGKPGALGSTQIASTRTSLYDVLTVNSLTTPTPTLTPTPSPTPVPATPTPTPLNPTPTPTPTPITSDVCNDTDFCDTFSDINGKLLTNHIPNKPLNSSWQIGYTKGTFLPLITDNQLKRSGSDIFLTGFIALANPALIMPMSSNYKVSAKVTSSDIYNDTVTLVARWRDSNNTYAWRFSSTPGSTYNKLLKKAGGVWTILNQSCGSASTGDTVTLEVVNTTIKAIKNGVTLCSATDSTHTEAGKAGVGFGAFYDPNDDISTQAIDDFRIQKITQSTPIGSHVDVTDVACSNSILYFTASLFYPNDYPSLGYAGLRIDAPSGSTATIIPEELISPNNQMASDLLMTIITTTGSYIKQIAKYIPFIEYLYEFYNITTTPTLVNNATSFEVGWNNGINAKGSSIKYLVKLKRSTNLGSSWPNGILSSQWKNAATDANFQSQQIFPSMSKPLPNCQ